MKYQNPKFTLPANTTRMTDDEYDLRVGNITQEEYDRRLSETPGRRYQRFLSFVFLFL